MFIASRKMLPILTDTLGPRLTYELSWLCSICLGQNGAGPQWSPGYKGEANIQGSSLPSGKEIGEERVNDAVISFCVNVSCKLTQNNCGEQMTRAGGKSGIRALHTGKGPPEDTQ